MKLSRIVAAVEHIRSTASTFPVDHELCSGLEWELWQAVLHSDAIGKGSPAKSAAALETLGIEFERHRS